MGFLSKNWNFGLLILGFVNLAPPVVQASESEVNLTEAIRGGVGSLRFSFYNQDIGSVKQGEKLEFRFPYREEKDAPVRILGVHQECGCLSQSLQVGQEMEKNDSGELVIKVDTTHFTGVFDKQVVILTNEDRDRPHVFRMRATIERLITVQPPVVELVAGEERMVRLKVQGTSKQTLHIEKVLYNEDTLEVQYYPVQEAWELQVRWKGSSPTANINETIELLTDGPVKSVKIPVVGLQGRASRYSLSAPR